MRITHDRERLEKLAQLGDEMAVELLQRDELRREGDVFKTFLAPYLIEDRAAIWIRRGHADLVSKHGVDRAKQIHISEIATALMGTIQRTIETSRPAFEWLGVPHESNRSLTLIAGVYCRGNVPNRRARELVVGMTLASWRSVLVAPRPNGSLWSDPCFEPRLKSVTDQGCSWGNVLNDTIDRRAASGWFNRRSVGDYRWRPRRSPVRDRIRLLVKGQTITVDPRDESSASCIS